MVKHLSAMQETWVQWVGKIPWRRKWQPTPVLLPGKSHGQRSLVGYTVCGVTKENTKTKNMTKQLWKRSKENRQLMLKRGNSQNGFQ